MPSPDNSQPSLFLVDASIYVFRSWFAFPDDIVGADGEPVNALFGFVRTICEILEQTRATHISVAYDTALESSFRNEIYPLYKANREKAPPELHAQFQAAREFTEALGLHTIASERYEADDLMASVAALYSPDERRSCFITADKDIAQLLAPDDLMWDFARKRIVTETTLKADVGIRCAQVPDYLALMGDAVDNIPGIRGVGAKSASALLGRFDDLEDLYTNLPQVESMSVRGAARIRKALEDGRDDAFMFRSITRLVSDAPVTDPDGVERRDPDFVHLSDLIERYRLGQGFGERLRRAASFG